VENRGKTRWLKKKKMHCCESHAEKLAKKITKAKWVSDGGSRNKTRRNLWLIRVDK